jgi:hypothetical protein
LSVINHNTKKYSFSDKSTSYIDITDFVEKHIKENYNKETTTEILKGFHVAIIIVFFLGNYPKRKHIQI